MKIASFNDLEKIVPNKNLSHTVFWLEGEENFFIDSFINNAEKKWVPKDLKSYDQTVLYGKETDVYTIMNACRRFPVQHIFQLVIIKEAQELKDINKLLSYIESPNDKTFLIIAYKNKKIDMRSKLGKHIINSTYYFYSKKVYDNELPQWIEKYIKKKHNTYTIDNKAIGLLISHIGNQLSILSNELDKLLINKDSNSIITPTDIETYIGINKTYNVYEFMDVIGKKNVEKIFTMLEYFKRNAKDNPPTRIINNLFYFFQKLLFIHNLGKQDNQTIAKAISIHPYFLNNYLLATKSYSLESCQLAICILSAYHKKDLGIEPFLDNKFELLKECVSKIVSL